MKPFCDLEAVKVRQLHVDERHVRTVRRRLLDGLVAVPGLAHDDEPASLEQSSRRCSKRGVVVDDEHVPAHCTIVPAVASGGGVASHILSVAIACFHAGGLVRAGAGDAVTARAGLRR